MKKNYAKITLLFGVLLLISVATNAQTRGSKEKTISEHIQFQTQFTQVPGIAAPKPTSPNVPINNFSYKGSCPDTAFFEDFQSQTIPAAFGNFDLDGLTDANGRPLDWHIQYDPQSTSPGDTNWVAGSSSWFTPAGTANNWLTTGPIAVCGVDMDLFWKSKPFEGPGFMDGYSVYISTTGNAPADFTGSPVFTVAEDVSAGGGTPGPGTVHSQFTGNNGLLEEYEVDLSSYAGQTIYIGFHHNSNDDNMIMLDDIFVGTPITNDLNITQSELGSEYTITPITQVQAMQYGADVELISGMPVTNPTLSINVWDGSTTVFSDNPTMSSQAPGSTQNYAAASTFTPSILGNYEVRYAASADEIDPNLLNNYDTAFFEVSDSVYARDNGNYTGTLGIGAGTSGFIGNQFEVFTTDDLTSVTFTLGVPTIGDTVVAHVYDLSGGQPNTIIGSTDTLFVTSAADSTYTLHFVGGPLNLTPGTYVVGLEESASGNLALSTETENYIPQTTWVFFNGTWEHSEFYSFFVAFAIRANFGLVCTGPVGDFTKVENGLTVDFSDASTTGGTISNWLWDFGDGNTSTMQNPSHTYTAAGNYTVCLTVTDACGSDSSCTSVTVVNCPDPVSVWSSSANNLVVDFTDASTTANTISNWLWDFGDGNTSTTQNPSHTYATDGNYTVCLTVTDACGTDSTCMFVAVADGSISIAENDELSLEIYPNPANDRVTISTKLNSGSILIRDAIGRVVITHTIVNNNTSIDLSQTSNGIYFIEVTDGIHRSIRRLVKK